jgi:hypothetical protein
LRNDLIWHKPNALPLREADRLNLAHEHFFHFVKRPKQNMDVQSTTMIRQHWRQDKRTLFPFSWSPVRMDTPRLSQET